MNKRFLSIVMIMLCTVMVINGATDQDSVLITVYNVYPDAQAKLEMYVSQNSPVTFDASGSIDTAWDIAS